MLVEGGKERLRGDARKFNTTTMIRARQGTASAAAAASFATKTAGAPMLNARDQA